MSASQNNKLTDNVAWWCSIFCIFCFCFSLDPCLSNPCVNGVCLRSSSSNSYACQCNTGYTGLTCDTSTTTGTNINRSLLSTIHEVCHSCTNLVHGIVLQQQWIWPICDGLFHKQTHKPKVSKRSSSVWETYPACDRTVFHARILAFSAFSPQLMVYPRLV